MKSCPTCNRTYPDDTLAFCLIDGSVLSAPYDPQRTRRSPARSSGDATQTQVLRPTVPSEPAPVIQSTIRAPAPQVPPMFAEAGPSLESEERKSKAPWVIAGVAVLLAVVLGVALLVALWPNKSETTTKQPTPTPKVSDVVENRSNLACNHPLSAPIYDKWIEMGGETGKLGCPIKEETDAPASPQGSTGRWTEFAKGDGGYLIEYTRPDSGTNVKPVPLAGQVYEVSGCMFKIYASLGGTKSWLGFPTADGHETSTGARQDFEAGYIVWDSKTYVCNAHKN